MRSNIAVSIPKQRGSGFEDENAFFRSASEAASPADIAAGDQQQQQQPLMDIATGYTRSTQQAARSKGKPRHSLPGQAKDYGDGDDDATYNSAANVPIKTSKAANRALQAAKEGRWSHISPSDLSTVSTAPPTPASVAAASGLINDDSQSPIVTQQDPVMDKEELTTTIAQQENELDQNLRDETATAIHGSPEPLPMENDNDDDEEDDQMVPPPPPSPPVTAETQEDLPSTEHEDFPMFDNDDDDDKEGEGFQLSSDQHADVGLPSEIDAEEKKSDDLNDMPSEDEAVPKSPLKTPKSNKRASLDSTNNSTNNNCGDSTELEEDDDKEGDGFNMVHDPETPDSVREERVRKEEKSLEQARKKKAEKELEEFSDAETPAKSTISRRKKKLRVAFKASPEGYPVGPREYSTVPVSDMKGSPDDSGCRRSRRAHSKPLAFWKNERQAYEPHNEGGNLGEAMGNMPQVASFVKALPTPRKKKAVPEKTKGKGKKGGRYSTASTTRMAMEEAPFDARKLKRKYTYLDGEEAMIWDDGAKEVIQGKIVSRSKNLERHDLPLPAINRTRADGKVVAKAAQAFNIDGNEENEDYVGYIMGHLAIPPKGIKDHESSGTCAHTFTVCHCQPNGLEISYADPDEGDGAFHVDTAQRFLLNPGDMFRIPQGNAYRIQNHSTAMDALLTWTIIRPHNQTSS